MPLRFFLRARNEFSCAHPPCVPPFPQGRGDRNEAESAHEKASPYKGEAGMKSTSWCRSQNGRVVLVINFCARKGEQKRRNCFECKRKEFFREQSEKKTLRSKRGKTTISPPLILVLRGDVRRTGGKIFAGAVP